MARLALDANAPIDFTIAYWQHLVNAAAPAYFTSQGYQPMMLADVPAGRSGNTIELVVDPMWNWSGNPANFYAPLAAAYAQAQAAGVQRIIYRSIFEALRRPY